MKLNLNTNQNHSMSVVKLKKYVLPALLGLSVLLMPHAASAASGTSRKLNKHAKSVTTPVAWGASRGVVFMGIGGTLPSPYRTIPDGAAVIGIGVGDPVKNVGIQVGITSLDVTEWKEYALGFKLHKRLSETSAIAVGGKHIMLTEGGDADPSYYAVYSKGFPGESDVHFSIGVGNGRYSDKSPADFYSGKGRHGTYVFGNVSYEVFDACNIIVDWNGLNLNAGIGKTFTVFNMPVSTIVGLADLTDYSGDRIRLVVGVGTAFKL